MSRVWFSEELETVAAFWRVERRDGITLGFTSHDADLWFDGVLHRATPGMVPSAIRRSADFEPDSAEVQGALSHESISATDLGAGRFDHARIRIGVVDWETGQHQVLYRGTIGGVTEEEGRFSAELVSSKAELLRDAVPRTSPFCRARFCGQGCNLSPAAYTHLAQAIGISTFDNAVALGGPVPPGSLVGGEVRWLEGPHAGQRMAILATGTSGAVLDTPLDPALPIGARLLVREGCDHTLESCASRFANAANFQGEPFLPGNDHLSRYPTPSQ